MIHNGFIGPELACPARQIRQSWLKRHNPQVPQGQPSLMPIVNDEIPLTPALSPLRGEEEKGD